MKSDEFIREVDEELQQERLMDLWKRYGNVVATVIILVVGGTGAYVGWKSWTERQKEAEAARYLAAVSIVQPKPPAETLKSLDSFAASASEGFRTLARMKEAEAAVAAGEPATALAALQKVAADSSADPLLRDAAKVMALGREVGSGDPAKLIAELQPLAAAGAPWRNYARQLLVAVHLRQGDKAAAKTVLEQLQADGDAPLSAQRRAQELLDSLDDSRGSPP